MFDLIIGRFIRCFFANKKETYELITLDELKQQNKLSDKELNKLEAMIQPGDELFFYRSSEKAWCHLAGREGYIVKRDGKQVKFLLTLMR